MTFAYFNVARLLAEIEAKREAAATRAAREFDGWDRDIFLSEVPIAMVCARVAYTCRDQI